MMMVSFHCPLPLIELAVQRVEDEGMNQSVCRGVDCHTYCCSFERIIRPLWPYWGFWKALFLRLINPTWFVIQIRIHAHLCGMILKLYTFGRCPLLDIFGGNELFRSWQIGPSPMNYAVRQDVNALASVSALCRDVRIVFLEVSGTSPLLTNHGR